MLKRTPVQPSADFDIKEEGKLEGLLRKHVKSDVWSLVQSEEYHHFKQCVCAIVVTRLVWCRVRFYALYHVEVPSTSELFKYIEGADIPTQESLNTEEEKEEEKQRKIYHEIIFKDLGEWREKTALEKAGELRDRLKEFVEENDPYAAYRLLMEGESTRTKIKPEHCEEVLKAMIEKHHDVKMHFEIPISWNNMLHDVGDYPHEEQSIVYFSFYQTMFAWAITELNQFKHMMKQKKLIPRYLSKLFLWHPVRRQWVLLCSTKSTVVTDCYSFIEELLQRDVAGLTNKYPEFLSGIIRLNLIDTRIEERINPDYHATIKFGSIFVTKAEKETQAAIFLNSSDGTIPPSVGFFNPVTRRFCIIPFSEYAFIFPKFEQLELIFLPHSQEEILKRVKALTDSADLEHISKKYSEYLPFHCALGIPIPPPQLTDCAILEFLR